MWRATRRGKRCGSRLRTLPVMLLELPSAREHRFLICGEPQQIQRARSLENVASIDGGAGTLHTEMHMAVYSRFTVRVRKPLLSSGATEPAGERFSGPRAIGAGPAVLRSCRGAIFGGDALFTGHLFLVMSSSPTFPRFSPFELMLREALTSSMLQSL